MSTSLEFQSGQNSLTVSSHPRLGIVTAIALCHAPDLVTALNAPAPDIGIAIPEWNPRQINRRPEGEQGGYDVIVSFEGHPDPDQGGESFELEGSASEDAIESHWNYQVLLKNYNGKEDANGNAHWPLTLKDGNGNKARNKMHGVTSYYRPGLIWNRNFVSRVLPGSIVNDIGVLFSNVPGNPPSLSGDREWLCVRVRARNRGNVWEIQQSWELSGPYGVAPELYARV